MESFVVGNTTVSSPLITDEVKTQMQEEQQLIQEVTPETMPAITRTPEQDAAITSVRDAISLDDDNAILTYGVNEKNSLMDLTSKTLSQVRASDVGDIGKVLTDLTAQLEIGEVKDTKGVLGWFNKAKNYGKSLQIRYESAQDNINRITGVLENNQLMLIKNNKDLNDMKEANQSNYKRLSVYVAAGKEKIKWAQEVELPRLQELAQAGNQEDINRYTKFKNALNLFEKQVSDLDAQMSLSMSMAIQLETLTNTNKGLIQKIGRSKSILIPAWNMYMTTAFYSKQTEAAMEADAKFTDDTNRLLKEVTKNVRETTKKTAEQSEKASIDITTLESMTSDIIASLKDIDEAQAKGREYRAKAGVRIEELRDAMKQQLASTVNNGSMTIGK